jgi:glycosyltransferase involved in cell wall biosynthesis
MNLSEKSATLFNARGRSAALLSVKMPTDARMVSRDMVQTIPYYCRSNESGYHVRMSQSSVRSSIVIPAHNEAENLVILIPNLARALASRSEESEIIIVDNASNDRTRDVIADFQKTMPRLRVVPEPIMGYGRAVLTGLRAASGDVIGIIRADNQEKPEDLVRMLESRDSSGVDFYKAIRMHRLNDGLKRVIISRVYNALFKMLFGLRSTDLNATPKVFIRKYLEAAQLESLDWFIDAEMVIKAERLGFTVAEMGIEYQPRLKGSSNVRLKHVFEFLGNMLSWYRRERHGKLLAQ